VPASVLRRRPGPTRLDGHVLHPPDPGAGSLHHAAFRAADSAHQLALADNVERGGLRPTGVFDRTYFRSVYFHEPGGVKLEIATDGPGFTVDEPASGLGSRLCLPEHLEARRAEIESH